MLALLAFKLAGAFFVTLAGVFFFQTAWYGHRQARTHKDAPERATLLAKHRRAANCLLAAIAGAILVIEPMVRFFPRPLHPLFWVHVPCAVVLLGLLVAMRLRFTGHKDAPLHRLLAIGATMLLIVTVPTGFIMLWQF